MSGRTILRKIARILLSLGLAAFCIRPGCSAALEAAEPSVTESVPVSETEAALLPGEPFATAPSVPETTPPESLPAEAVSFSTEPTGFPPPEAPTASAPAETECPETEPIPAQAEPCAEAAPFFAPYSLYFGLLHAHTDLSDGLGSVDQAFSYASQVENLDFFAVTDHSNSFDNAASGSLDREGSALSAKWAAGKAAAEAVTGPDFLGIFGFEMTWQEDQRLGHIATFGTSGWLSRDQEAFSSPETALSAYCQALTEAPEAVSQFCHPGEHYGDFNQFSGFSPDYADCVHLLEVGSGQEGTFWSQYPKALDAGWRVAPSISQNNHNGLWGNADSCRTVVLAEELTQSSLLDAIRSRRVYATQDQDLQIYYTLNGVCMGGTLSQGGALTLSVFLHDPTDAAMGRVEVVTEEGAVLLAQTLPKASGQLTLSPPAGYRYYFLRVTQPDGDIALTAPVWVEPDRSWTLASLETEPELPVQGQPFDLAVTLQNHSREAVSLDCIQCLCDQRLLCQAENPGILEAGQTRRFSLPCSLPEAGAVELRVLVRSGGETLEEALALDILARTSSNALLMDSSHENAGLEDLTQLKKLAWDAGRDVTVFSGAMPEGGEILLISAPQKLLDPAFCHRVTEFVQKGGTLMLQGPGVQPLLEALDSSLSLTELAVEAGSSGTFDKNSPWCRNLVPEQLFLYAGGFAVTGGSWLVKSGENTLLAWEETSAGGGIFLSGCDFLFDEGLSAPESPWTLPQANRTILQNILGGEESLLVQQSIGQARQAAPGHRTRVKGFVTAGTSNPHTAFPDTLYLQDDTGGIAVTGASLPEVQVGVPLEVLGELSLEEGNLVLKYEDHRMPPERFYRYAPEVISCASAMDYAARGGQLLQVEGTVTELDLTGDRKGISRLVLRDLRGDDAIIEIGPGIGAGSDGYNRLAQEIRTGRSVRAMGLLHISSAGVPVLRVRNCEEVVYVPPQRDPTNYQTGDRFCRWPF